MRAYPPISKQVIRQLALNANAVTHLKFAPQLSFDESVVQNYQDPVHHFDGLINRESHRMRVVVSR